MKDLTISDLCNITGGRLFGDGTRAAGELAINYKAVAPGSVFLAREQDYGKLCKYMISAAFAKGAGSCITDFFWDRAGDPLIQVEDLEAAIEAIGKAVRHTFNGKVISVTGSAGKTCTKEMIASVLSQSKKTLKTPENKNCGLSIPFLLSKITGNDEAVVVETGISDPGEMKHYASQLQPNMVVLTNIGHTHLQGLGSPEGVFQEKTKILDYLSKDAILVINGDDALLCRLKNRPDVVTYGIDESCTFRIENIDVKADGRACFSLIHENRSISLVLPAYGMHLIYAAAAAAAAGLLLGLQDEDIIKGVMSYAVMGRRSALTDTGLVTLIDDCYNANPEAMISAVDSLMTLSGRHVCILSDMLELGKSSAKLHRKIGRYLRQAGVDLVLACGNDSRYYCETLRDKGIFFHSLEELIAALPDYLQKNDRVLVKASHGMRFKEVSEAIKELRH